MDVLGAFSCLARSEMFQSHKPWVTSSSSHWRKNESAAPRTVVQYFTSSSLLSKMADVKPWWVSRRTFRRFWFFSRRWARKVNLSEEQENLGQPQSFELSWKFWTTAWSRWVQFLSTFHFGAVYYHYARNCHGYTNFEPIYQAYTINHMLLKLFNLASTRVQPC